MVIRRDEAVTEQSDIMKPEDTGRGERRERRERTEGDDNDSASDSESSNANAGDDE
jgi:small subunit ribosomal protein S6